MDKHAFQMVVTRQSFLVTNTLFVSQGYPPTLIGYLHDTNVLTFSAKWTITHFTPASTLNERRLSAHRCILSPQASEKAKWTNTSFNWWLCVNLFCRQIPCLWVKGSIVLWYLQTLALSLGTIESQQGESWWLNISMARNFWQLLQNGPLRILLE